MTALQLLLAELLREPKQAATPYGRKCDKFRIACVRAALADALYSLSVPNAD